MEALRRVVERAVVNLEPYDFDAFAGRGVSGAVLATALALRMNKTMIIVRKESERRHSLRRVEGDYNARRYVIADDVVCMGHTARDMFEEIKHAMPDALCLGVLEVDNLYKDPMAGLKTDWMLGAQREHFDLCVRKQFGGETWERGRPDSEVRIWRPVRDRIRKDW